jgi:hypothetical protein
MPHRTFRDETGRPWDVWEVVPTAVERRISKGIPRSPAMERRKVQEVRVVVPDRLQKGWLAFQSGREKRRLAPIPNEWEEMTARELIDLLNQADRGAGRRQTAEGA